MLHAPPVETPFRMIITNYLLEVSLSNYILGVINSLLAQESNSTGGHSAWSKMSMSSSLSPQKVITFTSWMSMYPLPRWLLR